ncbi:protein canopy homolog 2-like [Clavelina lepadiformis]|uniref:protein canopy homolog 2-like n=1 Tax=Clavelina lepadiformis TaxID=159417 RepID=UPI0040424336
MRTFVFFCLLSIYSAYGAKNKELYCGTCKAIVNELEHSISKVDPKKTINVGSYRVNPDGKTRTIQKSFARSEAHLTDLLESVCGEISENYVEAKDSKTGKKSLKRMVTHDGKMSSDVDFSQLMQETQAQGDAPPDTKSKKVKFACETIIEDFEDEILHHFKNGHEDASMKICADVADYCDAEETNKDEL